MNSVVAPALGISGENPYDRQRDIAIQAFNNSYMKPIVDQGTYLLCLFVILILNSHLILCNVSIQNSN